MKKVYQHSIDPKICDKCDYWKPESQSCLANEDHMNHQLFQPRLCMGEISNQANLLKLDEHQMIEPFCEKCVYYFGELDACMFDEDEIIRDEPRACYLKKED